MKIHELSPDNPIQEGEIGIEIEAEGSRLADGGRYWECKHEGSLRGEAIEYVLKTPSKREEYVHHLETLNARWIAADTHINEESTNTSVHVHINVQELTIPQLYTFICLYLTFETSLIDWCGESRRGNLFCLRAKDAEYLLFALEDAIRTGNYHILNTDQLRYASINVRAIFRYGSLEFRAMRGTGQIALVEQWVNLLLAIKDTALSFENPQEIVHDFSAYGPKMFHNKIFPDNIPPFNRKLLQEGVRQIQNIAYAVDWSKLKKLKKPAPKKTEDRWTVTSWRPEATSVISQSPTRIRIRIGGMHYDEYVTVDRRLSDSDNEFEERWNNTLRTYQRHDTPSIGQFTIVGGRQALMLCHDGYKITSKRASETQLAFEQRIMNRADTERNAAQNGEQGTTPRYLFANVDNTLSVGTSTSNNTNWIIGDVLTPPPQPTNPYEAEEDEDE